jgi:hypothetical protein
MGELNWNEDRMKKSRKKRTEHKEKGINYMLGFAHESRLVRHIPHLHGKIVFVATPVSNLVESVCLQHHLVIIIMIITTVRLKAL